MPHDRLSDLKIDQGDLETKTLPAEQESVQDVSSREGHGCRYALEGVKLAVDELQRSSASFVPDIRHDLKTEKNIEQGVAHNASVVTLQVQDDAGVQDEEIRREDDRV